VEGAYGPVLVIRATTRLLAARGQRWAAQVPVLVLADEDWSAARFGAVVAAVGRLAPPRDTDLAAVINAAGPPSEVAPPGPAYTAADRVRASVRSAASAGPGASRALVPALVTGDDAGLPADVVADFEEAGLTHLTAVSGTNLTLVLGFLLVVGARVGMQGRARLVLGLLGVVGFVLLARPEPSVVRAAAMGTVGLLGMGAGRRGAGARALSVAVVVLLLLEPALALSAGFALSALATAGILLVAPQLRDALAAWAPRWLAEAVAVPTAAQLACTPLVAALSGQVSLVAVAANLVVAPLVAPATVLGLLGGLVGLVVAPVGTALGWLACWCCQLVITVAEASAALPGAALHWPTGAVGMLVLVGACLVLGLEAAPLLRRRRAVLTCSCVLVVVLLRPVPSPSPLAGLLPGDGGWPPRGWVMVMCDVGQGDALAVRTAPGEAVVVDAGPDADAVDGCLRRLHVTRVPAVVLTHFHADHVDGLPGVLRGRQVAEIEVSPVREPAYGAAQVHRQAAEARVPIRVPAYGERVTVGAVSWQQVGPGRRYPGSPNDASVVLLVRTRGTTLLLPGDVEPPAQSALLRAGLPPVDVLKVPHHGSRYQDPELLRDLQPEVALVSVGEDNDYGHPDPGTLARLRAAGSTTWRTDTSGDLAVVRDPAGVVTVVPRD
jgi:competence protein ComEC